MKWLDRFLNKMERKKIVKTIEFCKEQSNLAIKEHITYKYLTAKWIAVLEEFDNGNDRI